MNIQGLLWFAVCFSPGKFKSKDRQFHLRPPGLARKTMTSSAEQKFVLVMKFLGRCHWNNNVRCIYMFYCLTLWFGSTVANHVLCIQGLLWFAVCFSPGKFKSKDRQFHLRPPGLARKTMTSSAEQKFVLVMKFLGRCHWNNNVRCIYMFCCLTLWFGSKVANHFLCVQGLLWFAVCFSPGKFKSKDRQFHLRPPGLARKTMTSSAEQKFVLVMKFLGRCHWNNNVRCIYMFYCLTLWFGSKVANHVLCIQGLLWFAVCFFPWEIQIQR